MNQAEKKPRYIQINIEYIKAFLLNIIPTLLFPNVRYISNHSKYYILFFLVSLNPPSYRTFSDF